MCIDNDGYLASLEIGKVYRTVAGDGGIANWIRVIDESGEVRKLGDGGNRALRGAAPGFLGRGVIGEGADEIDLAEVAELGAADVLQLAPEHDVKQLGFHGRSFHRGGSLKPNWPAISST